MRIGKTQRETPRTRPPTGRRAPAGSRTAPLPIHTLHLRAGRPIAIASRWLLPCNAVASLLEATVLPQHHPDVLTLFVRTLGGDTNHFHRLLDEASDSAPLLLTLPSTLTPPGPDPSARTPSSKPSAKPSPKTAPPQTDAPAS